MNHDFALAMMNDMLWTAMMVAFPVLGLTMAVGLLISLFQVVTQLQEMSLTFIPKLLVAGLSLIGFGGWMLTEINEFAIRHIQNIPHYF